MDDLDWEGSNTHVEDMGYVLKVEPPRSADVENESGIRDDCQVSSLSLQRTGIADMV